MAGKSPGAPRKKRGRPKNVGPRKEKPEPGTGNEGELPRLTKKQYNFVVNYAETGNAFRSYKDAYGTANDQSCHSSAHMLLKKPEIQEWLEAFAIEAVRRGGDAVLKNVSEFESLKRGAITEKQWNSAIRAQENIAKLQGAMTDTVTVEHKEQLPQAIAAMQEAGMIDESKAKKLKVQLGLEEPETIDVPSSTS